MSKRLTSCYTEIGCRIPREYFWVIGWGESDVGVETGSYDAALHMAGIENYNVMLYTSVLPPEAVELHRLPDIHHGSVLEGIIAIQHADKPGTRITAGVLKWEHCEDRNRFWHHSNRRSGRGPRQLSACKFRGARRSRQGLVPVSLGRLGRQTRLWMGSARAAGQTRLDRGAFNQAPFEERGSLQRDCNRWPATQLESSRRRNDQHFAPRAHGEIFAGRRQIRPPPSHAGDTGKRQQQPAIPHARGRPSGWLRSSRVVKRAVGCCG